MYVYMYLRNGEGDKIYPTDIIEYISTDSKPASGTVVFTLINI